MHLLDHENVQAQEVESLLLAARELPESSALRSLVTELLTALGRGIDIALLEQDRELTPNDAAAVLQVSRPYVSKLIRTGALHAHQVGAHHRIQYSDLLDFIDRRDRAAFEVAAATMPIASGVEPLSEEHMEELRQL